MAKFHTSISLVPTSRDFNSSHNFNPNAYNSSFKKINSCCNMAINKEFNLQRSESAIANNQLPNLNGLIHSFLHSCFTSIVGCWTLWSVLLSPEALG